MSDSLDVEMERDVLAACLVDQDFLARAIPVLDGFDFSNKIYGWIWGQAERSFQKTGEVLPARIWARRIIREYESAERGFVTKVLVRLMERDVRAPLSALEEVRTFATMAAGRRAAAGIVKGLRAGKIDEVREALEEGSRRTQDSDSLREPADLVRDAGARAKRYQKGSGPRIRLPVERLNELFGGGIPVNGCHLVLVTAKTNVGKTTFAADLCHCAAVQGAVVVWILTEDTEDEGMARLDARITGIPRQRFASGSLSEDEMAVFHRSYARINIVTPIKVVEMPQGEPVESILPVLMEVRSKFPDKPIFAVVDSGNDFSSRKKSDSFHAEHAAVYRGLKRIVRNKALRPIVMVSTDFVPEDRKVSDVTTAGSVAKPRLASVLIRLEEPATRRDDDDTPEPPTLGNGWTYLVMTVGKNRLGPKKHFSIMCRVKLDTCEFADVDFSDGDEEDDD